MDLHSHIYLLINDTAHTIALYSTVKCNGVPMYHLSLGIGAMVYTMYHLLVGICANGYPFSHIHTNK